MPTNPTVRQATATDVTMVYGSVEDFDGTSAYFETDQPIGSTPTLYVTLSTDLGNADIKNFQLTDVRYLLDPTYSQTYRLTLFEDNSADDYQHKHDLVFDSAAAQADNTYYHHTPSGVTANGTPTADEYGRLPKLVRLADTGRLYYMIDWNSGTPTSYVKGYLVVRGRLLHG